ncbi:MAG: AEC family transporter [Porticoccaceae bacterium]
MQTLIPMVLILAAGVAWRYLEPANISSTQVRMTMGALVINLFAPALILEVVLTSTLEKEFYQIPFSGLTTVALVLGATLVLYFLLLRTGRITRTQAGALVMASAFGNGMGIGLPAVDALMGSEWTAITLIYELLVTVPFVWTIGVLLCAYFGTRVAGGALGRELLSMPPFWAVVLALIIRYFDITVPQALIDTLHLMGVAAIPLLLLMVGISLKVTSLKYMLLVVPVVFLKLLLSPFIAFYTGGFIGLEGAALTALVMTSASPAVVVGIALCDRFQLDTELFCTVLTISTVIYVLLAPTMFTTLMSVT